jgi:hypothetical protein
VNAYQQATLTLNLALLGWEQGEWDRCEELLDAVPLDSPLAAFFVPWLDGALADARTRPRRHASIPDDARATDDKSLMAYLALADMFDAKARGDLRAAATRGIAAVDFLFGIAGLADDQIHAWPSAVECAFAAGDADAITGLLAVVDNEPPGALGRGYRAHRARFAALLAVRDGVDSDVEQPFREAISKFEEWGSPVYAAKARAELAAWLDETGRADEAARLRQEALVVLQAVGANGWLAELGLEQAPADAVLGP